MTVTLWRRWTRQPQRSVGVNRGNQLTRGLIQLSLTTAGTNVVPRNLVGGGANYITDFPGTASFSRGVGVGAVGAVTGTFTADNGGTGSGKGYRPAASALNAIWGATGEATVLAVLRANAADASGNAGPFALPSYASNAQHYPYTDGNIYIGPLGNARYVNGVAPPSSVYVPHTIIATHKSGASAAYFNGVLIGTGTHAESPFCHVDGTPAIGGNGAVFLIAIWDRVLTATEAKLVGADPWQLFAPSRLILPMSAGAAPSVPSITAVSAENITATSADYRVTLDFA